MTEHEARAEAERLCAGFIGHDVTGLCELLSSPERGDCRCDAMLKDDIAAALLAARRKALEEIADYVDALWESGNTPTGGRIRALLAKEEK